VSQNTPSGRAATRVATRCNSYFCVPAHIETPI
jgi:hypothetical protein